MYYGYAIGYNRRDWTLNCGASQILWSDKVNPWTRLCPTTLISRATKRLVACAVNRNNRILSRFIQRRKTGGWSSSDYEVHFKFKSQFLTIERQAIAQFPRCCRLLPCPA